MARPGTALRGKVAVITGGTRGIGLMIAATLAQAGAQVALCGRTMQQLEAVYTQFVNIPGVEVLALPADVRRPTELAMLADQTVARFGKIDVWINNAAIAAPYAPFDQLPADSWRDLWETNVTGVVNGMQAALLHMLPRNVGKIVNIIAERVPPYQAAYAASKASALKLTLATAQEYHHTNLSILAFTPNLVDTQLYAQPALTDEAEQSRQEWQATLHKQASGVIEVGDAVTRLVGRESDGVTGKVYDMRPGLLGQWRR